MIVESKNFFGAGTATSNNDNVDFYCFSFQHVYASDTEIIE